MLDPDEYLGPPVPGRSVAILGDTCNSSELAKYARNLDVLGIMRLDMLKECLLLTCSVHEATMENKLKEKCVEFGHSTPAMAAEVATSVRAETLILFHVSPRYRPVSACDETNKHESADILLTEAVAHLKQINNTRTTVLIAEDFTEFSIPKHNHKT